MSRSLYTLTNFLSQKEILCVQGPTHISFLVKFFVHARSCSHFFPSKKFCECVQGPAHISFPEGKFVCVCKDLLIFHPIPGQISASLLAKFLSHSWPGPSLIPTHVPVSNLNPCLIPTKVPVSPVLSFPGLFPTLIMTLKNLLTT